MRLINSDDLKVDYILPGTSTGTECKQYVSLHQILNAPTIELRRMGKWIHLPEPKFSDYGMTYYCSNCGHRAGRQKHKTYRFCPWCGALMIKES